MKLKMYLTRPIILFLYFSDSTHVHTRITYSTVKIITEISSNIVKNRCKGASISLTVPFSPHPLPKPKESFPSYSSIIKKKTIINGENQSYPTRLQSTGETREMELQPLRPRRRNPNDQLPNLLPRALPSPKHRRLQNEGGHLLEPIP